MENFTFPTLFFARKKNPEKILSSFLHQDRAVEQLKFRGYNSKESEGFFNLFFLNSSSLLSFKLAKVGHKISGRGRKKRKVSYVCRGEEKILGVV